MTAKKRRLSTWQYVKTIAKVAKTAFRLAPSAAAVRIADSIVSALLPIATTYYAALTTTALADAYAGSEGAARDVIVYVLITSGLGIVTLVWGSVGNYITQKTRYQVSASVEDDMMRKFSSLPFEMYDDKNVIDLHEKAKRFSSFFSYIFDTVGSMISSMIGAIAALVALVAVSPWLALIVTIAVLPNVIIQVRLARQQTEHWNTNITRRRRQGNMGWMLQESRYMAEMRIYGVAKYLIAEFGKLREKDEKERLQFELKTIWKQLLADIGESLVQLGALVWIVLEIINRNQPVGQFVYVQQMVSRAISSAGSLASQLGRVDEDLANIVDYRQFIEITDSRAATHKVDHEPHIIRFEKVSFRYPKTQRMVLQDISLEIARGQHIAVIGENGAGKSTFIKLLMGLYAPTDGRVVLDDRDLVDVDLESWHRNIAILGQDFISYYFAQIRENITLGDITREESDQAIVAAMEKAQFASVVKELEHGDRTYIERWMAEDDDEATATELSGGQYQRLALARNFYRDSPIMILDEPTSAIDALAEQRIFEQLFASDKTIVTVSHRLSTIKPADYIYVLKAGKIAEKGTYDELVAMNGEFVRMFNSQMNTQSSH